MEKKILNILTKANLTKEQALAMSREELLAVPGIGPKTADAILAEAVSTPDNGEDLCFIFDDKIFRTEDAVIEAVKTHVHELFAYDGDDMTACEFSHYLEEKEDKCYERIVVTKIKNANAYINAGQGEAGQFIEYDGFMAYKKAMREKEFKNWEKEHATPAVETAPIEEPVSAEETAPAEEFTSTEETIITEEAAPAEEAATEEITSIVKPAKDFKEVLRTRMAMAMAEPVHVLEAKEETKKKLFIASHMNVLDEHVFDDFSKKFVEELLQGDTLPDRCAHMAATHPEVILPDLSVSTMTPVAIGDSHMSFFLKAHGISDDNMFKWSTCWDRASISLKDAPCVEDGQDAIERYLRMFVDPEKPSEKSVIRVSQALMQVYLNSACKNKVVYIDGKKFVLLGRNATEIRLSESVWIDETCKKQVFDFAYLGRFERLSAKLAMSKLIVYGGLVRSNSKRFVDKFGHKLGKILMPSHIRNAVVLPDIDYIIRNALVDLIDKNDKLSFKVRQDIKNKMSDGLGIHIIDDEKLGNVELSKLVACSTRLPLIKNLKVPILRSAWITALKEAGKWTTIDSWGVEKDLRGVEMVLFESSFKGWKGFDSWDDYVNQLKAFGCAEWRVCVACRHGVTNFPTQQVSGLLMDDETLMKAVEYNYGVTSEFCSAEGCWKMLGGKFGDLVRALPALINSPVGQKSAQGAWGTNVGKVLGGNFLRTGTSTFVAPDILPLIYMIVGKEPKMILSHGQAYFNGFKIGRRIIMTRNPHPTMNYAQVVNTAIPEEYNGLYLGGCVFFSWEDPFMILLQMDFDGDKLNLVEVVEGTFTEVLWNAIDIAIKQFDYRPLVFENNTPKTMWTEDAEYESVRTTSPAPIGLFDNAIRIVLGIWKEFYGEKISPKNDDGSWKPKTQYEKERAEALSAAIMLTRTVLASLEAQVTLCVDEAKNGSAERVNGEPLIGDCAKAILKDLAEAKKHKDIAYAFKKVSLNNVGELANYLKEHKFARNFDDAVGKYSLQMAMRLPEKYECKGAPAWDIHSSWKPMTSGKYKRTTALELYWLPDTLQEFKSSSKSAVLNNVMEWVEENTLRNADGIAPNRSKVMEHAKEMLFSETAKVINASADEIVDSLIMAVFCRRGNGWQMSEIEDAQRFVLEMFFENIMENIAANKKQDIVISCCDDENDDFCFHDEDGDTWYCDD